MTPMAAALLLFVLGETELSSGQCLIIDPGSGGSPVITMTLNDTATGHFILDTAASGSTIDDHLIQTLNPTRNTDIEQAQVWGGPTDTRVYRLASLRAGPLELRDVSLPGLPPPQLSSHDISGLAGVDLFGEKLAIWQPDRNCVEISPSGTLPQGEGWTPVQVRWTRAWKIMLPITIEGVPGWGLLDTGAQTTVLNTVFAEQLGLTNETSRLRNGGEMFGVDGHALQLSEAEVGSVTLGPWNWDQRTLKVGELPVFQRLGEIDEPLAIIGADWLHNRGFAIDYGRQKVWLRKD